MQILGSVKVQHSVSRMTINPWDNTQLVFIPLIYSDKIFTLKKMIGNNWKKILENMEDSGRHLARI